ncbi:hypothetical protein Pmar_PMAR012927 [Perkinsus marinus ATCC 50983]|uniref:Uncharacterized protein n=1 Tax=Perkinsus marinus (strain ATCC 50983 / TXsc) TaxID=423536 RepID=C5LWK1_PERM5|nr:hypothetical protein Pmar_PMAR012927 [Perkinsus marinus ATCC 50983]EEQ98914.1 hypothetical protein Pmar_PMAR012927 [Perkinsus marinus ATCC 50983]|eukprot:XP_002766197.1 hypothetical protein Pmar_PMAR012927 [Perkinsus marinus ATCC 50983]
MLASSPIIVLLLVSLPSSARREVSISSQEWLAPTDTICEMFSMGVSKFLLESTTLVNDGSVFSEVVNVTMVNEIADCARKYGTGTALLLGTDSYPYHECSPDIFSFATFESQIQSYITQYNVEEVRFWVWVGNCQQFFWQIAQRVGWIISRKLKTRSGKPVRASIGFGAEPLDSPLWKYVEAARLGRLFDTVSIHFGHPTLLSNNMVDADFARQAVQRLLTLGVPASKIELSVEAMGYSPGKFQPPRTYAELIAKGALPFSNGHFEDYTYQSQKQVLEKTCLVEDRGLYGFSISTISEDLPARTRSSLLYAALHF